MAASVRRITPRCFHTHRVAPREVGASGEGHTLLIRNNLDSARQGSDT